MQAPLSENDFLLDPAERALVQTALNHFTLHHEAQVSIAHILKASGTSKAAFYRHFSSKDDLYAAILLYDLHQQQDALAPGFYQRESIATVIEHAMKNRLQTPEKHRVILRLEEYLEQVDEKPKRYNAYLLLRQQMIEDFCQAIESRTSEHSPQQREKLLFHYAMIASLTRGITHFSETDYFHQLVSDRRGFSRYILETMRRWTQDI